MAVCHNIATDLENPAFRQMYEEGRFSDADRLVKVRQGVIEAANDLWHSIFISLCEVLIAAVVVILLGFLIGSLDFDLGLKLEKSVPFVGTCLAAWATLMELGGALVTWKGESLHELIHPLIFQLLFVLAVAMMLIAFVL